MAPDWSHVPVPASDAPRLAALALITPIAAAPNHGAPVIGYLRLGAKVARSAEPVARGDCAGGWYAVRPSGFVCAGNDATVALDHPLVRAMTVEPDRARPMPYPYAFVRAIAPNYLRVPTKEEQFKYEMRLERHLRSWSKLAKKWDDLDVGANDVPLDADGFAVGGIPEHATPLDVSHRFGGDGTDAVPWWLRGERRIPNVSSFKAPPYAVIADRVRRHAGVALVGTFVAGTEAQERRFAITTDARLLPADKLKADSGSPFHGYDIRKTGLPVAFVANDDAVLFGADGQGLTRHDAAVSHRTMLPLTGKVRMHGNDRLVETRDGH
ncbi:MAG TPA: L,D-transpeptidase, partial [Polyangiaceae bacterium]